MNKILLFLIAIFSLLIASCTTIATDTGEDCFDAENDLPVNVCSDELALNDELSSEFVSIPVSEVSSKMKKYSFDADGVKVTYFAVKGSDGKIRTAFDACDVCGGYKGYFQRGSDIVCLNCGRNFRIDGLGTQNKGYGCWPSYLSHNIEGGNILINKKELLEGAHRFA